jgi:hypothetical protein
MKFKKGITGFWAIVEKHPIPQIDEKKLKECAYMADFSTEFKLEDILTPDPVINYYKIFYRNRRTNEAVALVVNSHYPYYAAITIDSSWMQLTFVDLPDILKQLFDIEFEYLSVALLNSEFTKSDMSELFTDEIRQINYWKSKTYGEVIFNGYD